MKYSSSVLNFITRYPFGSVRAYTPLSHTHILSSQATWTLRIINVKRRVAFQPSNHDRVFVRNDLFPDICAGIQSTAPSEFITIYMSKIYLQLDHLWQKCWEGLHACGSTVVEKVQSFVFCETGIDIFTDGHWAHRDLAKPAKA